jgi:hypothetical protein
MMSANAMAALQQPVFGLPTRSSFLDGVDGSAAPLIFVGVRASKANKSQTRKCNPFDGVIVCFEDYKGCCWREFTAVMAG